MSLRTKTMSLTLLILFILFGLLYFATQTILLDGFARLEQSETSEDVHRVLNVISSESAALTSTTADWAFWDDTYQFIQDANTDYIQSNLTDSAISTLKLNIMLFTDNAGQIVYGKAFDLNSSQTVELPKSLSAQFKPGSPLVSSSNNQKGISGILALPEGPLLFTSEPILTSQKEGPVTGRLLFGQYLTPQKIREISEATFIPLNLFRFDDKSAPDDVLTAIQHLTPDSRIYTQPFDQETVVGYSLLEDIYGKPVLVLRINVLRDIFQQGQNSISYLLGALLVAGMLCCGVILWILNRLVLARLVSMSSTLASIRQKKDQSIRIPFDGKDEIANLAHGFNEALDALEESRATLHTNQELLHKVITSAPLILFALDLEGKITLLEGKVLQNLGINPADMIGQSILETSSRLSAFKGDFASVLAGNALDLTVQLGALTFATHYSPRRNQKGEIQGIIGIATDITEQHQTQKRQMELEITLLKLEKDKEILKVKHYFISKMSHEFRTPLAIIQAAKETLTYYFDRITPQMRLEKLDKIGEQIQVIVEMLEEVLTLSQANTSGLGFTPRRHNLVMFCRDLFEQIRLVDQTRHQLVFSTDNQICDADIDERLLQHILGNLLSNAIKYSPDGGDVGFDLSRVDNEVIMKISDQGIGIPEIDQEYVFEPFRRGSNTQSIKGTGLGLAIAKESVEAHGGTISFESIQGKGSTFIVRLPLYPDSHKLEAYSSAFPQQMSISTQDSEHLHANS